MLRGWVTFLIVFIAGSGIFLIVHNQNKQEALGQTKPSEEFPTAIPKPRPATGISTIQPSTQPLSSSVVKANKNPNLVQMAFVGDIMLASGVETLMKKNGFDYPFK